DNRGPQRDAAISGNQPIARRVACERWLGHAGARMPSAIAALRSRSRRQPMGDVEIFSDRGALVRAEAERIVKLARQTIEARGRCLRAWPGGSTPRPLYELLAKPPYAGQLDWSRVHLFWGDERCVPPDHPDSNYRMTRAALIDRVPIPAGNVH